MKSYLPLLACALATTGCGSLKQEAQQFCIENPSAAAVMASSDAAFNGKESAPMSGRLYHEANALTEYRSDQPATKVITFEGRSATAAVAMATDRHFSDLVLTDTVRLESGAGSYAFRNMVPGRTYHYKVSDGRKVLASGAFLATGQLRMIAVDDGFNIRDLGGWTGLGGKTLRYEALYRGGSPGGTDRYGQTDETLSEQACNEFYRIGIRAHLDLRAASDEGRYGQENSFHSYARDHTTLKESDYNQTQTDYGAYNEDASVVSDLAWIIYELRQGRPVYFNCRQGADRTGTIAFMIEGLTGCFQSANSQGANQMAIDYELTSFSRAELVDKAARANSGIRGSDEAFTSRAKLFRKIMDLAADDVEFSHSYDPDEGCTESNMLAVQERCYYYLNRYWSLHTAHGEKDCPNVCACIDDDDLDWFIMYMLGMSRTEYSRFKPSWAFSWDGTEVAGETYSLRHVGEANAKVVEYCR